MDRSPCELDEECGNRQLCLNQGCTAIYGRKWRRQGLTGSACENSLDCTTSHACRNQVCSRRGDGAACRSIQDCGNGAICDLQLWRCQTVPLGRGCRTSAECASGMKCLNRRCLPLYGKRLAFVEAPIDPMSTCQDRYDCQGRQLCRQHTCVSAPLFAACKQSSDCGNGLTANQTPVCTVFI